MSVAATTIVYVSCAGPREIHCFGLDPDSGALTPFDVVAVPGGTEPSPSNLPLALAPGGIALYAALRTAPFPVTTFAIDGATGRLMPRGTAPLPAPMAYIAASADGRFLLGASYKDAKISVSAIARDGVEAPPAQVVATPPKAHCIMPGRAEGIVYATTVAADAILVFRLDAKTGRLAPAAPHRVACRPGSGPRHLALHPRLDVLYCVNELAGTVAAFAIESGTGALSEMQYETLTPPGFTGSARAADLHVTADGRFAYASVRNTNAIAGFAIAGSGTLSPIGRVDVETSPRSFALDPHARFLICAGQGENTVAVYAIDPATGALALRHRYAVGSNPSWVETLALPRA